MFAAGKISADQYKEALAQVKGKLEKLNDAAANTKFDKLTPVFDKAKSGADRLKQAFEEVKSSIQDATSAQIQKAEQGLKALFDAGKVSATDYSTQLDSLKTKLKGLFDSGKIGVSEYLGNLKDINQTQQELTASTKKAADAAKQQGDASKKASQDTKDSADKAKKAVEEVDAAQASAADRGVAFAQGLAAFVNGVYSDMQSLSKAAYGLFRSKMNLSPIGTQADALRAQLADVTQHLEQSRQASLTAANSISSYLGKLTQSALETKRAWLEQKIEAQGWRMPSRTARSRRPAC